MSNMVDSCWMHETWHNYTLHLWKQYLSRAHEKQWLWLPWEHKSIKIVIFCSFLVTMATKSDFSIGPDLDLLQKLLMSKYAKRHTFNMASPIVMLFFSHNACTSQETPLAYCQSDSLLAWALCEKNGLAMLKARNFAQTYLIPKQMISGSDPCWKVAVVAMVTILTIKTEILNSFGYHGNNKWFLLELWFRFY